MATSVAEPCCTASGGGLYALTPIPWPVDSTGAEGGPVIVRNVT